MIQKRKLNLVELKYLKSNNTLNQYLNTGYYPNGNSEIEILCRAFGNSVFFGVKQPSPAVFVSVDPADHVNAVFYQFGTAYSRIPISVSVNDFNRFKINRDGLWINDEFVGTNSDVFNDTLLYPLYLFGRNNAGALEKPYTVAIKEFIVRENNRVVMHLTPVLDTNSNPCMYDSVNNIFYYNANNTNYTDFEYEL
jgi:hypothetical protein